MLTQTSPGLQIYRMGTFSFLPIQTLFVLEGCWSVDIPSNKIRFTAEVLINALKRTGENCSFICLFIFLFLRNNISYKQKLRARGLAGRRRRRHSLFKLSGKAAFENVGSILWWYSVAALWRIGQKWLEMSRDSPHTLRLYCRFYFMVPPFPKTLICSLYLLEVNWYVLGTLHLLWMHNFKKTGGRQRDDSSFQQKWLCFLSSTRTPNKKGTVHQRMILEAVDVFTHHVP